MKYLVTMVFETTNEETLYDEFLQYLGETVHY